MPITRSWKRAMALAAVAALATVLPTAVTSADPRSSALVQCQGTETVTYHPGVTFQPRPIAMATDGRFGSCAEAGGKGGVTSGSYGERFTVVASCNTLNEGFRARRTFTWNTGEASVAEVSGSSHTVAGQVVTVVTGTIEKGRYRGHRVVELIPLPQPGALQCLGTGFTGATGVTTLTIV
ncbi:hypothetical protein ACIHFE_24960 [Streptomyces sp. NPDC052396]|uniref:hypothetical protein n=1 Tax=Streptomyces sp. NPDC052396 TaxID=3365689 RepID=UPI0037CEA4E7